MPPIEKTETRMFHILCIIIFALCLHTVPLGARTELVDRIVAVIDQEVILWSELNFRVELELQQSGHTLMPPEDELNRMRMQALTSMVDEQVLILKAKKDSILIDESQVGEILNERFNQVKNSMEADKFRDMLERVGLTERQLKNRYRKDIRHSLLFDQLQQVLKYRLHITHKDVESFRQAHRDTLPSIIFLSQIKIGVKPDSSALDSVRQKIQLVQQKLAAGEDFAALARSHSEDPGTAAGGGDLGCFEAGLLMPEFERAAFQLKPTEISEPVLTKYGYHLIQLQEKREDELCASHILVRTASNQADKERTQAQLEELRQRALGGENFAELARNYSEDPSAKQGGLWNRFNSAHLPPFLQPYLGHLKLGEISAPLFLDDGGYIIKINDDHATLEGLMRDARLSDTMRQQINDFKDEIYLEKRMYDIDG